MSGGPIPDIPYVSLDFGRSWNLRLMIHYIGDIHQPLHSVSRYTPDRPNGDAGGNFYGLERREPLTEINNMHSVWDSVIYSQGQDFPQPLEDDVWEYLGGQAIDLRTENPESAFAEGELDTPYQLWSEEAVALSKEFVYTDAVEGEAISDEYLESRLPICRRQLAKGGYRLARMLTDIYDEMTALSGETSAAEVTQ